ncbi:uracil/xanthine transporter [Sporosarcina sp. HYO08]|uniref:uracil/xanthine transporter n=1 Tax=Sporosarcina sp. HYO08 TaxID=1759557 RepID=UPI000791244F|nr:uracil/xanthine transporter [Sporosarcina sp. HYO08]KXH80663.1 uracil/xanthine transporter [Sporosarcina sp. HYO08]
METKRPIASVTLLAGFQWLFFMFANTIVIPISVGAAFQLEPIEIVSAIQRSFIFTGTACLLQGFLGHRKALMEGQSGLWWGVILSLAATASTLNIELSTVGGSIAVGVIISGILIAVFGLFGMGNLLQKWFTPIVMFVFLLLLANQLITIFLKGMVGLNTYDAVQPKVALFSFILAAFTILVHSKGKGMVSSLNLLIGMVVGWIFAVLLFPAESGETIRTTPFLTWFPWGQPALEWGIILTIVITGLLNTTNTIATLKGSEDIFHEKPTSKQYRNSFFITGALNTVAGVIGLVPYAPYASSLGFLQATGIRERAPFFVGSLLFILLGMIPELSAFFSTIPHSVGNTVLFVAYLQLFRSALRNIEGLTFDPKTVYRIALPALLGLSIMGLPKEVFATLPNLVQPLISNGLLVGILAALVMELLHYLNHLRKRTNFEAIGKDTT